MRNNNLPDPVERCSRLDSPRFSIFELKNCEWGLKTSVVNNYLWGQQVFGIAYTRLQQLTDENRVNIC